MPSVPASPRIAPQPGLCADCVHARRVRSDRGSEFLLCELSRTRPEFPRYPRLPVLRCAGHQPLPYTLRQARMGDLGWMVHRHGALYAEMGYDWRFEAVVARVVADFIDRYDSAKERAWVAERDGRTLGSVLLVKKSDDVAKLRMLIVEPEARGIGLGARLVQQCVDFARQAGYRTITLWTHQSLTAARRLYERAGFRLVDAQPGRSFGLDLVDETWDLEL